MQLPQSKNRTSYIDRVKQIESKLKAATTPEKDDLELLQVQEMIDALAQKYQHDPDIGKARYKLYELQALVHHYEGRQDDALDFINQAIETRGESYARAENLKKQFLYHDTPEQVVSKPMSAKERRKNLVGLEGWLALFSVGIGIGLLYNIVQLASYPSSFADLESMRGDSPTFVNDLMPILQFEVLQFVVLIGLAIWLIVLFAQRKKLARIIAIIVMITPFVLGIIDYVWTNSIIQSYNIDMATEMSKLSASLGRSLLAACVWVPYFIVSKRVKATFTK